MAGLTNLTVGASYDQLLITKGTDGVASSISGTIAEEDSRILDGLGSATLLQLTTRAGGFAELESQTTAKPLFTIKNTTNDTSAPTLRFINDKGAAGADNDDCGTIEFYGDDDNQDNIAFATILAEVADASNGDECGRLSLKVAENDGTNTAGLVLTGSTTDGEVDVTVGAGAASAVAVPGVLNVTGLATFTGRLITDNTTEATSTTDGSLQTDGGLSVAKDCVFGDDVFLITDGSVLNMGIGSDVKLTHDGTTGGTLSGSPLTIDSAAALNLYGTSINVGTDTDVAINIGSDTLDIDASGAIDIDGTDTIDIGANTAAGAMNIGTNATARAITMGNVTGGTAVRINSGTGGVTLVSTGDGDITLTSADDITLDAADDIVIDSDGDLISMKWGGATGQIDFLNDNSGDGVIQQKVDAKDLVIRQFDGTEVCRFEDGGTIRVGAAAGSNDWFRLPKIDGSANQVLSTNGSGTVSWAAQEDTAASATLATTATNVVISDNESTNENNLIAFVADATGASASIGLETDGDFHYNPSTGLVSLTNVTVSGTTASTSATTGAINTLGGIGCAENSWFGANLDVGGALTVSGVLSAGSISLPEVNHTGTVTLNAGTDVILDADGDDFIFNVGGANTSGSGDSSNNELMRINWGKEGNSKGSWATGVNAESAIRFEHVAYLADNASYASSPVFHFAGRDAEDYFEPTAGVFGIIDKHGFRGLGKTGNLSQSNQCLGNGDVSSSTDCKDNTLINIRERVQGLTLSGSDNVFIGHRVARTATSADGNTYVGNDIAQAQEDNSITNELTGNRNSGFGYRALHLLSSGAENTCIGSLSGISIKTGSYNICIGPWTKTSGEASQNQITIGDNIGCTEDNQFTFGKESNVVQNEFDTDANWTRTSDIRKKRNIKDDKLGLEFIDKLRTVTHQWKPSNEFPEDWNEYSEKNNMNLEVIMHGMIAQEVKQALDEVDCDTFAGWKERSDGSQTVSREMFVIPLIKAVQELSAKVKHLETNNKTVTHIN